MPDTNSQRRSPTVSRRGPRRPRSAFICLLASKFHEWHESDSAKKFVDYLKTELSGSDKRRVERENIRKSFIEAGINPDVHLRSRIDRKYVRRHLPQIILELSAIVGRDQLHDNAMHSSEYIPLLASLRCSGTFPLSMEYDEEPRITRQALQRKLVAVTGTAWASILKRTGFSQSTRRIASRNFSQTVQMFVSLDRRSKREWTKTTLRQNQPRVFSAAWNLRGRMDSAGVPVIVRQELCKDPILTLWSIAKTVVQMQDLNKAVRAFLRNKATFAEGFYATRQACLVQQCSPAAKVGLKQRNG
jgi:hypothetical protein